MKRITASIAVLVALVGASCSPDGTAVPTTPAPPSTGTTTGPTTTATSIVTAGTTTTTTGPPHPDGTSVAPGTTAPELCDTSQAETIVDSVATLARLDAGGTWQPGAESEVFGDRTNTAAEYGSRLAYTCAEQMVQHTATGAERLALVAWNDVRHAVVLQATDGPSDAYDTKIRFQLFLEQPDGEWLEDGFVWAATLADGDTIVIATRDYSTGITAKSWQSFVPRFEDLPVTLESERFGIEALTAVGARNVSVAEPAPYDSSIGTIQFNTPIALSAFAVIGPADAYDPMVPIVADGVTTFEQVDGVRVRSTVGMELVSELHETGWVCADHAWRLYTMFGTVEELQAYARDLVRSLSC